MAAHDILLMGAVFPDVPKVLLPIDGGGTAVFTDVSDTDAAAGDVASGKYFYTADGTKTQGTASGGGGLVYETGTFTPTSDIGKPTISFSNAHTDPPFYAMIFDSVYPSATNSVVYMGLIDWHELNSAYDPVAGSGVWYGRGFYAYRSSSGSGGSTFTFTSIGTSSTSQAGYFLSNTAFTPYASSSRYFRSGRTYKWIAVWKS